MGKLTSTGSWLHRIVDLAKKLTSRGSWLPGRVDFLGELTLQATWLINYPHYTESRPDATSKQQPGRFKRNQGMAYNIKATEDIVVGERMTVWHNFNVHTRDRFDLLFYAGN